MKIEHVALYVNDLENARRFFMKYFGAKSNNGYHNLKTGYEVKSGPRITGDDYYESCIVAIEQNQIEITI